MKSVSNDKKIVDRRAANAHGADFEKTHFGTDLAKAPFTLVSVKGFENTARKMLYAVHYNEQLVGYYGMQHGLYHALSLALPHQITNEYIAKVLSRKIIPDEFVIVLAPLSLVILEKKTQYRSGSVDEKLQTAPYKLAMFEKLLGKFKVRLSYVYILNEWFNKPGYRNVLEYYELFQNVQVKIKGLSLDGFSLREYFLPETKH